MHTDLRKHIYIRACTGLKKHICVGSTHRPQGAHTCWVYKDLGEYMHVREYTDIQACPYCKGYEKYNHETGIQETALGQNSGQR